MTENNFHHCADEYEEFICSGNENMSLDIWDSEFGGYRFFEVNYCPICGKKKEKQDETKAYKSHTKNAERRKYS